MGLKEKLERARKTKFLTEGFSSEEISRIVKGAQRRAALVRKELDLSERRKGSKNKLERKEFQSEYGMSPEWASDDLIFEQNIKSVDYSKIAQYIHAMDAGKLSGDHVEDDENHLYAYAHPDVWEIYKYDCDEMGFRVICVHRNRNISTIISKLRKGPWEWI